MQSDPSSIHIARKWLRAFNEHNLENLLSLYHDSAEHFSPRLKQRQPETNGFIKGKDSLRTWWKDAFDRLPELQYIEKSLTANDNRVFIEYTRQVPHEADSDVAELLVIENGLIVFSRVYLG